jgi:integrase
VVTAFNLFLSAGLAYPTRKTYNSAWNSFVTFCRANRLPSTLPAAIHIIELWVADLGCRLQYQSIKVYLAGFRSANVDAGLNDPIRGQLRIERLLRGIKRIKGAASKSKPKLPITTALLERFEPLFDLGQSQHRTIRAAMWVATTGLLRTGEFTSNSTEPFRNLRLSSLRIAANHSHASLRLLASKTDIFRESVTVHIFHQKAIAVLTEYISHRSSTDLHPDQPLFPSTNGQPISRNVINTAALNLAAAVGIKLQSFSTPSFRRGGATSLAKAGVPDHIIKVLGRWSSVCYTRYIHTPLSHIQSLASAF